jgi:diguanylate cyclase (GGDEF)-like protein
MRRFRRDVLLYAGLAAFLVAAVWSTVLVTSRAVEQLLRQDAETEGKAWARYLAANVSDLDRIVAGAKPSADSLAFFVRAEKVGNVFRYKIYAPNGELRLSSHAADETNPEEKSIVEHNPEAASAVLAGKTVVEVKSGGETDETDSGGTGENASENDFPAFYSEAYVPVVVGGTVVGIMEAYVDQSEKRAAFDMKIGRLALSLAAIIAIAFGLPGLGFAWRTRQKQQADSRADFLAQHDALTAVLNRTRFMRDLDEAIRLGCAVAVHVVDINGFKDINDTHGQAAGDDILRQVAQRLQTLAQKENLLARLGSDDFALAEIVQNPRQITRTARHVIAILGEAFRLADREIEVTVSVGSALAPTHGTDAASLLKSAEIALHHSKSHGRGTRSLFRPEMDAELRARRELESLIRNAVANEGFELHFQPIRRASDRRLRGFEALLRLPKADGGRISPALFVPIAEYIGLIGDIGDWVIRRACAVAASWPNQLSIAVNLSPVQFEDGRIAETVRAALEASGLAAKRLEIEITEGLLLSDAESIMRQLAELKRLGVRIAMDDFGTGYSSLAYLWKFPFDKLKIDQSFTRALSAGDDHVTSVIQAIVALGRSLGMRTTAEGVETEMQAEFLVKVGCDELQGFHFGRPMPLEEVAGVILQDFRSALPTEPRGTGETRQALEA